MINSIFTNLKELKKQNVKIGFTCSTFDLLHAGHIAMLAEAKTQCDYLIVGLQNDPSGDRPNKNKPIQTLIERQIQLYPVSFVNEIVVYNTEQDLEDILKVYPIDVRILGVEYKDKEFTGKNICIDKGMEIYYNSRDHAFSSTDLRKRVFEVEDQKRIEQQTLVDTLKQSADDLKKEASEKELLFEFMKQNYKNLNTSTRPPRLFGRGIKK